MNHRKLGLMLAATIFVVDQIVKFLIDGPIGLKRQNESIEIISFFDLTRVHNHGVSLGLFTAQSDGQRWALVALTAGIAAFVGRWLWTEKNRTDVIGLSLILGGALGNIVDRARFGYVLDYADLHFGDFRPFLVFNVADAAITVGVLILLARAFLVRDAKPELDTKVAETENA